MTKLASSVVAGALFDFLGFLTTSDEPWTFSRSPDASPAIRALELFAEKRSLLLPEADVKGWQARLQTIDTKSTTINDDTLIAYAKTLGLRAEFWMTQPPKLSSFVAMGSDGKCPVAWIDAADFRLVLDRVWQDGLNVTRGDIAQLKEEHTNYLRLIFQGLRRANSTLQGAVSAYETFARGDPFKSTRVRDFERAANDLRHEALSIGFRAGELTQAEFDEACGGAELRPPSVWLGTDGRAYGTVSDEQVEALLMCALKDVRERSGLADDPIATEGADDTLPWPKVTGYAGGASMDGAFAWVDVQLTDGPESTRFVRARPALESSPLPEALGYWQYKTEPGESVMGIAIRELKDGNRWREIVELNNQRFPEQLPNEYYPVGTLLTMPSKMVGKGKTS